MFLPSEVKHSGTYKKTLYLHSPPPLSKPRVHINHNLPHHDYFSLQFWEFSFLHWMIHHRAKGTLLSNRSVDKTAAQKAKTRPMTGGGTDLHHAEYTD